MKELLPNGEPLPLPMVIPRKGHTQRDAQKALMKLLKCKDKVDSLIRFSCLADFGALIKAKGTHEQGIAMQVFAANKMHQAIERCEQLSGKIDDPELKVRLEERVFHLTTELGKLGQGLAKSEEPSKHATNNNPGTTPFPPHVAIQVNNIAGAPEKPIDS